MKLCSCNTTCCRIRIFSMYHFSIASSQFYLARAVNFTALNDSLPPVLVEATSLWVASDKRGVHFRVSAFHIHDSALLMGLGSHIAYQWTSCKRACVWYFELSLLPFKNGFQRITFFQSSGTILILTHIDMQVADSKSSFPAEGCFADRVWGVL